MKLQPPFLVQVQDAEGFWCNVYDEPTLDLAKASMGHWAKENEGAVRIVSGPKRQVVASRAA